MNKYLYASIWLSLSAQAVPYAHGDFLKQQQGSSEGETQKEALYRNEDFIMLPICEQYLGFNATMLAILLGFNVILDPLITSTNVLSNGLLGILFEKIWNKIQKTPC